MKRSKAFTVGEALIAMAIIGLLAMLLLPVLKKAYQRHTTVTMLKKGYQALEDALDGAISRDYAIDLKSMNKEEIFRKIIVPHFNIVIDCQNNKEKCFGTTIYDFEGKESNVEIKDSVRLAGGFSVGNKEMDYYIDINGPTEPNRLGVDVFHYKLENAEIKTEEEEEENKVTWYNHVNKLKKLVENNVIFQPAYADTCGNESDDFGILTAQCGFYWQSTCSAPEQQHVITCNPSTLSCFEGSFNKYGDRTVNFSFRGEANPYKGTYTFTFRNRECATSEPITGDYPLCSGGRLPDNCVSTSLCSHGFGDVRLSRNNKNLALALQEYLRGVMVDPSICIKISREVAPDADDIKPPSTGGGSEPADDEKPDEQEPEKPLPDDKPDSSSSSSGSSSGSSSSGSSGTLPSSSSGIPSSSSSGSSTKPSSSSSSGGSSPDSSSGTATEHPSAKGKAVVRAWKFVPYEYAKEIMDAGWKIKYF